MSERESPISTRPASVAVAEMRRSLAALALELPWSVHKDVVEKAEALIAHAEDGWKAAIGMSADVSRFGAALQAICTTDDSGPWIEVYRAAGGGYEGLQAIAEAVLSEVQR